jgi:hypothetical protein
MTPMKSRHVHLQAGAIAMQAVIPCSLVSCLQYAVSPRDVQTLQCAGPYIRALAGDDAQP